MEIVKKYVPDEQGMETLLKRVLRKGAPSKDRERIEDIVETYRGGSIVIKVGESVLRGGKNGNIVDNIGVLLSLGIQVILVHGGGKEIDKEMGREGLAIVKRDGFRVSDKETVNVVERVLTKIGSEVAKTLNETGIKAVQILGHEGVLNVEKFSEELGYVGIVKEVETKRIFESINSGIVPVITPLGSCNGDVYNINADFAGGSIASALGSKRVVFITDTEGIYDGINGYRRELSVGEIKSLIESGVIREGMIPKATAAMHAVENHVNASIINGIHMDSLLSHLFRNSSGTRIDVRE